MTVINPVTDSDTLTLSSTWPPQPIIRRWTFRPFKWVWGTWGIFSAVAQFLYMKSEARVTERADRETQITGQAVLLMYQQTFKKVSCSSGCFKKNYFFFLLSFSHWTIAFLFKSSLPKSASNPETYQAFPVLRNSQETPSMSWCVSWPFRPHCAGAWLVVVVPRETGKDKAQTKSNMRETEWAGLQFNSYSFYADLLVVFSKCIKSAIEFLWQSLLQFLLKLVLLISWRWAKIGCLSVYP